MAAYFVFFTDETKTKTYDLVWHVGNNVDKYIKNINNLSHVQVDGDEASDLYGIGMELEGNRVHELTPNESRLYLLMMNDRYKNNKDYRDIENELLRNSKSNLQ